VFYQRRLPHFDIKNQPAFLTWRLHGSLPSNQPFPGELTSGQAFVAMDKLLDTARTGFFYLRQPEIADLVVEAILFNSSVLSHYDLHAFVVMPNHVHLLVTPSVPLPKLTKSLKSITARRANAILGLTGTPFWQDESYDHLVRHIGGFEKIRCYIEQNPVRAALVAKSCEYRWPSAGWGDQGVARGPGVRPTFRSPTIEICVPLLANFCARY
jgi:putative DNA methylase